MSDVPAVLELALDRIVEIEATTTVLVETDLVTELDPDGEITLQLLEQSFELTVEPSVVIEILVPGAQGPPGGPGPTGAPGPSGSLYRHVQAVPSSVWTVVHNLDFEPNVTVIDSAGSVVEGDTQYVDDNTLILTFTASFGGRATLS